MQSLQSSNGVFFDNYYQISARLASCKKIKKSHLIILADTISFNARGQVNFKSQDRIASECGVNRGTVINAIKQLREWGLLSAKESKFKETLKLTVNYPNLLRYIEENETVYQKERFNPVDDEVILELKENGWITAGGCDVEKPNSAEKCDEHQENHDVEKSNTRCWKIQQPMLENPTLIDHVIDHVSNKTTTTTTRERENFDFESFDGYSNGSAIVPQPPEWAKEIFTGELGDKITHPESERELIKQFGGFVVYNLSRGTKEVSETQARSMFVRWLSKFTPSKQAKPVAPKERTERQQVTPPAQPEFGPITPAEEIWLKSGRVPVGLRERLGEDKFKQIANYYGLKD